MFQIQTKPLILAFTKIEGLQNSLESYLHQLDVCQKALNDYLEEKRNKFSRFYFLGDDDLLEILGQSQNPEIIQQHLKKLFGGIHRVTISKGNITQMLSAESEEVNISHVKIVDAVEDWMSELVKTMQNDLQKS